MIKELEKKLQEVEERISALYKESRDDSLEWYRTNIKPLDEERRKIESQIRSEKLFNVQVGDGVSICCYTDVWPYTVIRRTPKTIVIQADNYKRIDKNGAYSEQQEYEFSRNENGRTETFRWNGKRWVNGCYRLSLGRYAYYDYSF